MMQNLTGPPIQDARILLAEDSTINRRLATLLLEMMGCQVDAVVTGYQAIEAFQQHPYDLVLMNCNMPSLDGYEATARIREIEYRRGSGRHVPIIAITAFALPTDHVHCLRMGMDDCLIKPFRRAVLEEKLRRWLTVRSMSA